MIARLVLVICLSLCGTACTAEPGARSVPRGNPQILHSEPLNVHTADGRSFALTVEVARTYEQQAIGLMNRTELAPDHGMLFDFSPQREVSMWMRNTYISLDMLFIDQAGGIVHIAARTVPHSEEAISAGRPVRAVLELAGGAAERLGISIGDRLEHPIFTPFLDSHALPPVCLPARGAWCIPAAFGA